MAHIRTLSDVTMQTTEIRRKLKRLRRGEMIIEPDAALMLKDLKYMTRDLNEYVNLFQPDPYRHSRQDYLITDYEGVKHDSRRFKEDQREVIEAGLESLLDMSIIAYQDIPAPVMGVIAHYIRTAKLRIYATDLWKIARSGLKSAHAVEICCKLLIEQGICLPDRNDLLIKSMSDEQFDAVYNAYVANV